MVALRAGILQYETSAHDILLRRVAACILISRCACVRGVQPRRGCARRPVPVHTLGLSQHACSSREASAANPYHLHDKYVWNTRQIFYVMRREGIPPDVDTYTLFLMVLAADPSLGGTRLEAAGDVVLQMEAEGLELHALTYGAWMQVSLGFRVWDLGLRVQGTVQGTGLRAQGSQTSTGCKRQRARARVCWHACVRMHRRAQRARTTGAQISHTHKHTHTHPWTIPTPTRPFCLCGWDAGRSRRGERGDRRDVARGGGHSRRATSARDPTGFPAVCHSHVCGREAG